MISGLILTNTEEKDSRLAFLSDETQTFSLKTNKEIIEKIKEFEPDVLAANVGVDQSRKDLTKDEEDLIEEGYSFTPSSAEPKKVKRLQALQAVLARDMETPPDLIRFDPFITSKELALDGDKALSSIGIDSKSVDSSKEFDALLGAITARFYQQNQFEDYGVVVPKNLNED